MSDLLDVIKNRRSIRHYQDREVPREALHQVLEAVRWSPSWNNSQCWEIVVVKDPEVKLKLQKTMPMINPAARCIVEAPLVLAMCGKLQISGFFKGHPLTKFADWFMFDLGLATQSLCLAAHNEGLGTVIAGAFDHEKAKEVLQVPEGYEVVVLIPMGYPDRSSGAPTRREIGEFVHYGKF